MKINDVHPLFPLFLMPVVRSPFLCVLCHFSLELFKIGQISPRFSYQKLVVSEDKKTVGIKILC